MAVYEEAAPGSGLPPSVKGTTCGSSTTALRTERYAIKEVSDLAHNDSVHLTLALLATLAAPALAAPAARSRLEPFPLRDVRLLDGPFRDMQQRGLAHLLSLDPDRLLHTFRLNVGLPTSATPYGGWEAPQVELRGHSLGHYLTACALAWEATGDERLKTRALAITAELRRVQLALAGRGGNPGYLSAFPEEFFDRVEQRRSVWAPYYTLHKILAGLLDVHRVFSDVAALETARGMAAWVGFRAGRQSDAQWQEMLQTEFGGMQESLTELYAVTGDPEHLRLARLFDHRVVFDPLARGEDPLDGLHANTQIPKAIGAERDCELTGEPRYCRVAETFWRKVALGRSYAIGGHSEDEHFFPVAHFSRHLGESTAETCNTYNMLKLSRDLFRRDADAARIDFYERGLFNHILASNDPASGQVTYFVSMKPGAWRTYSTAEDSFWCCVGTGMENPARFGEAIYFHTKDALYVSLFLASDLTWREKGLSLRQETRFPDQDAVHLTLRLEAPIRFALNMRHPAWVDGDLSVSVNGLLQPAASRPGSYATLEREWRDGDVVDLRLPMRLHAEPMPDDPTVVAFLQGPIVLAADLGSAPDAAKRHGPQEPEFRRDEAFVTPTLVAATTAEALARLRPTGEPLTFRTEGLGRPLDIVLRPFFRLYERRHAVYLPVVTEAAWAARGSREASASAARRAVDARTVDVVLAGSSEEETAHAALAVRADTCSLEGRRCRRTRYGGSFSYVLRIPADGPVEVRVTYWGGETRRHIFDVTAESETIATQSLFDDRPGELYEVQYPLPERLTRGRDRVRIGFRTGPSQSTGAVFEVRVVRNAAP